MAFFSFAHTSGTNTVQNGNSTVDHKSVFTQNMLCEVGTCKAIEVADTSAHGAFLMKVILAVAVRANILIKRSTFFTAVELAQNFNLAKFAQMTVKAALARGSLLVDLGIKLVHGELAVWVASEKAEERFPARGLISLFSHLFSP